MSTYGHMYIVYLLFFYFDLEAKLILQELALLGELAKIALKSVLDWRHVHLLI